MFSPALQDAIASWPTNRRPQSSTTPSSAKAARNASVSSALVAASTCRTAGSSSGSVLMPSSCSAVDGAGAELGAQQLQRRGLRVQRRRRVGAVGRDIGGALGPQLVGLGGLRCLCGGPSRLRGHAPPGRPLGGGGDPRPPPPPDPPPPPPRPPDGGPGPGVA